MPKIIAILQIKSKSYSDLYKKLYNKQNKEDLRMVELWNG